jgi:hypothetical protein
MKVLVLVISSDSLPVYEKNRAVWRRYMHSNPNVDCYFIQFREDIFLPMCTRDTLYLRGGEGVKNITRKTVLAMQYFLPKNNYTHVVRTNLSSVWDFPELLRFLGSQEKTRLYCGMIGVPPIPDPFYFVSGAGIVMSIDVAHTVIQLRNVAYAYNYADDVDIAFALRQAQIYPSIGRRVDFLTTAQYESGYNQIPTGTYHYRMKNIGTPEDREREETDVMNRIVTQIYNK